MATLLQQLRDYFADRPEWTKVIKNVGWLSSDKVVRLIIATLVGAWIARYLGKQGYGQLSVALAFIILIVPILQFGFDALIVERIVEAPEDETKVLGTAFCLRVLLAVVVLPIALTGIWWFTPENRTINQIIMLLALGMLFHPFEIITFYFQSHIASRYAVIAQNTTYFITSILKILAIWLQAPVVLFGFLFALDTSLYMIGLVIAYHYSGQNILTWRFDPSIAKYLLSRGLPLMIAAFAFMGNLRFDQLMLANLLEGSTGVTAVGLYAVAARVAELWYFIPQAFASSMHAVLIKFLAEDKEKYHENLQKLFRIVVFIAYGFAILLTFTSHWVILVVFGQEYIEAAPVLMVLAWSGVGAALNLGRIAALHAEKRYVFNMVANVLGLGVNILLNFILIPRFGVMGSAIATLISFNVIGYFSSFLLDSPIAKLQTRALIYPNPFV